MRASPKGKHKAIAFEVFSPRLLTRKPVGGAWIISLHKIIMVIMHKKICVLICGIVAKIG